MSNRVFAQRTAKYSDNLDQFQTGHIEYKLYTTDNVVLGILYVDYLLQNKIKLFNLQSEVLTYFARILKDGFSKSFINYSDFKNNKRELVKRNFLVA